MTLLTRSLAPALLLFALGVPAEAAPLPLSDLLHLADEGVGEAVLLSIAENQGVRGPLGVDEVLAMNRADWSDELMAAVVMAAAATRPPAAPAPAETVAYEERDGAVVARLHGEPGPEESRPPGAPARPVEAAAPPVVVVQAAAPVPAPADRPVRADGVDGYPVGAQHGWSGSTVFLPAHFGGSTPSSFGRAIVTTGGGGGAFYGGPYAPPIAAYGYAGPVVAAPQPATTTIRTSRGLRRVPN